MQIVPKRALLFEGKREDFPGTDQEAFVAHMESWKDLVTQQGPYDALVWDALKHFRIHSLNKDFYTFDGKRYPMYARLRPEEPLRLRFPKFSDSEFNQLKMMLTTSCPLPIAENGDYGFYAFEECSEVYTLGCLTLSTLAECGRSDVTYQMLTNSTIGNRIEGNGSYIFQASREKVDGARYVHAYFDTCHFLLGKGWMVRRADVEVVERIKEVCHVLYPSDFISRMCNMVEYRSHPWESIITQSPQEGRMFMINGSEYRMKNEPTTEILSSSIQWKRSVIVEVASRGGQLVPLSERYDKVAKSEVEALVYLSSKPSLSYMPSLCEKKIIIEDSPIRGHIIDSFLNVMVTGSGSDFFILKSYVESSIPGRYTVYEKQKIPPLQFGTIDVNRPFKKYEGSIIFKHFYKSPSFSLLFVGKISDGHYFFYGVEGDTPLSLDPQYRIDIRMLLNGNLKRVPEVLFPYLVSKEAGKMSFFDLSNYDRADRQDKIISMIEKLFQIDKVTPIGRVLVLPPVVKAVKETKQTEPTRCPISRASTRKDIEAYTEPELMSFCSKNFPYPRRTAAKSDLVDHVMMSFNSRHLINKSVSYEDLGEYSITELRSFCRNNDLDAKRSYDALKHSILDFFGGWKEEPKSRKRRMQVKDS